ncbi:MAG TPA: SRPBCC domain-containing protein [Candidatus Eisenbacteria bacterium]|nr:SRPBCC domain-containing protein [Candidatus Eisenbacteria bacterium]
MAMRIGEEIELRERANRRGGAGLPRRAFAGFVAAALAFACAGPAFAASQSDPNAFTREAVFDGPSDILWHLLTTEAGVESWLAPHADVDLRVGGLVRTNHDPDGKIGDPMTLVNRIVALSPGRSLAVRVDRTPQGYPMASFVEGTWYEVSVDPLARDRTRLRCVGHGLPTGYAAYMVRPMFEKAADMVFEHLRAAVERQVAMRPAPKSASTPKAATAPKTTATTKSTTTTKKPAASAPQTSPPKTTR